MPTKTDMWSYPQGAGVGDADLSSTDITGFGVEALDGGIGKIDEATHEVRTSEIVVDTGPWILGRKVMLPAGVVDRIDTVEEKVYVHRTKDQIKNAPELEEHGMADDAYRDRLGSYYGPDGPGWTDYQPRI